MPSVTASLTWPAVVSDPGVTGYAIYRGTSPITLVEIGRSSAPAFVDLGPLNFSTTYCYAVAAINAMGVGPKSLVTSQNTGGLPPAPAAPTVEYTLTP